MRRADRLFRIVQILRNRQLTTAGWLAEELAISQRTVYRDIRDLERSGIPIRGEAGVGYQLDQSFELPPLVFSAEEIEALVLGARFVSVWADPELKRAAAGAMEKIEDVLPPPLKPVLGGVALFAIQRPWAQVAAGDMTLIRRAIAERRRPAFGYVRADGETSQREVRPLGLYFWGSTWSLAAWCELRQDYRNFRPDRMRDARITDARFDESDGISLPAFIAKMEG